MEWLWLLLLIPLGLVGAMVCDNIYNAQYRPPPKKVFQEEMTRRWTEVRKAEEKVKHADWNLKLASLDVQFALRGYVPMEGQYISSQVLTWTYEHDRAKFDIFMAHNNRIDLHNLGYSALLPSAQKKYSGEYDAQKHSDLYW